jgi:glyoxylase-like metal-dependent hydrolase (beta-lactamase superfamily II)
MKLPLEDLFEDIVGKAQRGLGISDQELSRKSGVDVEAVRALKDGIGDRSHIPAIAAILGLGAQALTDSYSKSWYPESIPVLGSVRQVNTPLIDMTVNAYVVWDPQTKEAAIFDTGVDATQLFAVVKEENLIVKSLFLTHTHEDHVAELKSIINKTQAEIYSPDLEYIPDTKVVREGDQFRLGNLRIEARLTNGHSPGGTSYVVSGIGNQVAVVGDSLFAGSMGGAPNAYKQALRNNAEKLLSLPGDTLVCPGHGPFTTIANEQTHNPFFS